MVEQVAQKSLVKTIYFVSPEYMSIVFRGEYGDDDNWHEEESHKDNKDDTISKWILQNTLHKMPKGDSFYESEERVASRLRVLMGENGVWCEITCKLVYDETRRQQIGETKKDRTEHRSWKYEEPYKRVLRVLHCCVRGSFTVERFLFHFI